MYRSLHTTVLIPGGTPCEVQIRTREMHEVAEHGIAAHWRYKEGFGKSDRSFETKITWLRSLIDWRREMTDAREFIESLKADMFEEQVYVFTPKGKIIDLPVGSTPVDFAYRIHSEVGHRCAGAKVNNRMVSLDYQIQNAEIVQIMTSKASRGPSRDWLNFVKTDSARSHIKRYFRRLERDENIAAGRDLLEKELKRLGLSAVAFDDIVSIWGARNIEDLFALIGSGETTARQVAQKVLAQRAETQDDLAEIPQITPPPRPSATDIRVRGESNLLTRMAKCCNPVVGEPIVGFITRGKGVTVHRADCRTILNERDRERLVDVAWGSTNPTGYPVPVRIESWDRVGLWRDVSGAIADAEINIESVSQRHTRKSGRAVLVVVLKIQSINQLTMILDKLNRIPDVIEARRESYGAMQSA
jgi:GTP pyrophosphokinase